MSALNITKGGSYEVTESNSTITIATTDAVTLTGSADNQLSEVVISTTADNANLTIDNLNITNASKAIITVGDGSENTLNITGENVFEVSAPSGACVNVGGGLTINGTGSFKGTSISGAVIGINGNQQKPDSNIKIESGTFDLTCRSGACAIGGAGSRGNAIGNITITGTADITASAPSGHAAPIGASYWGSCGDILINGDAKITSTSGQHSAAIGGASLASVGNITIGGNAQVNAINASIVDDSAAIGSGIGSMVQSLGDISITDNAKVTASSNLGLAIDNIEYHREQQQYGTTDEGDYYVTNENKITIGGNATFNGTSGDIYTPTTINGKTFKAAKINYNKIGGLTYSGGSSLNKDDLEETLLEITSGGTYTIAQGSVGKILINTSEPVTLQGGNYTLEEIQIIGQSDNIDLTINDLRITNKAVEVPIIKFGDGSDNKLTVKGHNDFDIEKGYGAGVNIGGGGTIGGTGLLKILTLNGAAIGTNGQQDLSSSNVVINSGSFDLRTRSGACGIGGAGNGSKIGNITITGTAHVISNTPQGYAAAIGSAYRGTVGDILINGDATVNASSGLQSAAIGSAVYCHNGDITIGGRASVVANTTSTDVKDAAIGGSFGEQVASIGDIKIIEDATVIASSAHGLALDNILYVEGETHLDDYYTPNKDNTISISGDRSTANQSTVILTNGNTSDSVIIGSRGYQGGKIVFYDGALAMTGNWSTIDNGWEFNSIVEGEVYVDKGVLKYNRYDDKFAHFSLTGGNLKDDNSDGIPDNISIGSILYVKQSGTHTNVRNLSGNVIYNGDALGVEGDNSYNIEAVSPIDLSETVAGTYITDPHVTAMRLISDGATISPRGDSGTGTVPADWYSFDNLGGTVTFKDGSYCLYPEKFFSSRNYTKVDISNNNRGVKITAANDFIHSISNLADGYQITIESGIAVGDKINFNSSGDGVIVVKSTANSGKYSLASDSNQWQYQRFSLNGGDNFNLIFGDHGSVTGMENFSGSLTTDDTSLINGTWVTLSGGKFQYSGSATNDSSKSASFTLSGNSIKNTDNLLVKSNLYVAAQDGNRIAVVGMNGNASVDNIELGIGNDTNYSAHFTKTANGIRSNVALMEVSNGASINNNYSIGIDDNNAQIQFSDGNHVIFTDTYLSTQNFTTINASNGGNGFTLNVAEDKFSTISGLNNGYEISINAGGNVSDSLNIHTDGGTGTISIKSGSVTNSFKVSGDDDFGIKINSKSIELTDFEGWLTVGDGVYKYVSDTANFSLSGAKFDPNAAKMVNNVEYNGTYRIGLAGLNDNVIINGAETGIFNDADYSIHGSIEGDGATITSAFNISDGASVSGAVTGVLIDDNAEVSFADGNYRVGTVTNYSALTFDSINVDNGGKYFTLTASDGEIKNVSGLVDAFHVSITPAVNIGDVVTFKTDGGSGTIANADTTLKVDGDEDFSIKLDGTGNIEGLKNFSGAATITGNKDFDRDLDWAIQHQKILLDTDEEYSSATLTNATGDSLKVYYTNNTTGGVIDLSNETLTNAALLGQGASSTLIGSQGDDQIMGIAATVNLIGNEGNDTFRGGHYSVNIEDYKEDEDSIYLGSTFNMYYPLMLSSVSGNDLVFTGRAFNPTLTGGSEMTIINGADMKIKVFDSAGNSAYVGNYWTIADYNAASITALENVKVIDASARTTDIQIIGNALNNTIIGGGSNATFEGGEGNDLIMSEAAFNSTMTGGTGNDTFRGGANLEYVVITDYTEGEDVVYHGRAFADLSINGSIEGSDYVFHVGNKTINVKDGADKVIEVINVEGERRLFGKYLTLDDNDPATVTAQEGVATIDATLRTKDIVITGNTGNNTIISSSGDCTLYGGGGQNTFVRGNRTSEQTITVADYTEGEDVVHHSRPFGAFSLLGVAKSVGDDYIFKVGTATIAYTGGANKKIKFVDVNGDVAYFGNYITVMDVDANTIEATEKVKVLDASARTKAVNLTGNALANSIMGGTGNDTLTGGDGADLFVHSAGNDVITDYTAGDKISIGAAVTRSYIDGSDVIFNTDGGSLTVKNGAGKSINLNSADTIVSGQLPKQVILRLTGSDVDKLATLTDFSASAEKSVLEISGNRSVDLRSFDNAQIVSLGSGNQTVQFNDRDYNVAVVDSNSSGNKKIIFGSGKDLGIFNGANATVDMANAHDTTIAPYSGTITLDNYSKGATILIPDLTNAQSRLEGNELRIDSTTAVKFSGNAPYTLITLADSKGATQKVGFGRNIDTTSEVDSYLLKGFSTSTITAGAGNDTIFAGSGSVSGGKGHDKIIGATNTTYLYTAGDGRDTIENFNFTTDKIQIDGAIDSAFLRGSDVMIKVDGGFIMLEGGKGKSFHLNDDLIAKVDDNVEFDGFSNFYVGSGRNSTLTVGKGLGKVEVWLSDDSLEYHGTRYDGDFKVLDASQADGRNILAGNELNNVIMGGSGNNTLWGGNYGDDLMIGGTGKNTFTYSFGNGDDRIQNTNNGDKIILDDITFDQIKDTNITANRVAINFTDGGSLTISGTSDLTYQLADGSKLTANHATRNWDSK